MIMVNALPLTWEQRPFGKVLYIDDILIVSVSISPDLSYMIYQHDTYDIRLYHMADVFNE